MKLLITGATGLVGNELVKMALKQGMIIHYLTTHKSKHKKNNWRPWFLLEPLFTRN